MQEIDRLLEVMARLRNPEGGCPWDLEQTFETIAPYTIEEAYEVWDAIHRGGDDLQEELGDLLLQVVYHAQMAREEGRFDFEAVVRTIADKMITRHPHVFGDAEIRDAGAQSRSWEALKEAERTARAKGGAPSVLADVPGALPALTRAEKLQKRAARVGFDWPTTPPVLDKIEEETIELRAAIGAREPQDRLQEEIGDLLFAIANLARHLEVDPEEALRHGNAKFERRFRNMERTARERGTALEALDLEAQERLWEEAKAAESTAAAAVNRASGGE